MYKFLCRITFHFSWGVYLRVELPIHMVTLCLTFWGTSKLFFHSGCTILQSLQQCMRVPVLHNTANNYYLFDYSHPSRCEMVPISLCFWFAFSCILKMLSIFFCAYWPYVGLLWGNVCSDPLPIFQIWFFLSLNCKNTLLYSRCKSLIRDMIYRYFLPFSGLSFHFLDGTICSTKVFNFDATLCECIFSGWEGKGQWEAKAECALVFKEV